MPHQGSVRRWTKRAGSAGAVAALVFVGANACKGKGPGGVSREEATALLQQEAQAIKATGEKLDPVLRVKATWKLVEATATERPGDADRPWSGLIRFHIRAETQDTDGKVQVDEMDKRFEYLWSESLHRWLIQPSAS
ncbi:MAG TPA: hypothetical protein VMX54_03820 [Vicinamibacteria bacterium]|nr:hypothetical protein [Vicinamibacteria bacterium]